VARLIQTLKKRRHELRVCGLRTAIHKAQDRYRRLLRAPHYRPSNRRAADQRDELAPLHSITSSASVQRASTIHFASQ